jgi:hypothetical protein
MKLPLEYGRELKLGLGIWGLVPLPIESVKNCIRVSSTRLHIPRVGMPLILLNLTVKFLAPRGNT